MSVDLAAKSASCIIRIAEVGIGPSVGSVGDSYYIAPAETINGLYKAEGVHRRGPWRSFDAVEHAMLTWIDWFHNHRLLQPIRNMPPTEDEERYYASLAALAMAELHNTNIFRQIRGSSDRDANEL